MTSLSFTSEHAGLIEISFDASEGGRATSWRVDGVELLCTHGTDPVEHGMYVMAPWAGRLESNSLEYDDARVELPPTYGPWALHGVVMYRPVSDPVITITADYSKAVFTCELIGWPWPGQVQTTWVLDSEGLRTEIEVSTPSAFPAILGWHPWFRRELAGGALASWHAPGAQRAVREGDFATGELQPLADSNGPFDDAFYVPAQSVLLRWEGWGSMTIQNSHPWFVVFDELPDALCIEPQTNVPNAMNTPVVDPCEIVRSDQPLRMVTRWRIERDRDTDGR